MTYSPLACWNSALRQTALLGLFLVFSPVAVQASEDLFREQVAPIFARRCLSCHSETETKGDLSLATAKAAFAGGESGEVIEPGEPESSYLIDLITPHDGKAEMPKNADPLSQEEIATVRKWIANGAPWPADFRIEEARVTDRDWWSLAPLVRPIPPGAQLAAGDLERVRTPIDAFVLAKLRKKGMDLSPEADRRTLVRRLYHDLIGLPPTPDEIDQFVNDTDPQAYEKLVDELLESPHYGERWARHWLDVVQYGDTHGYDKDKQRPNAWPYRDYVIRSFNDDKPYARFVQEQLAGDYLWPETEDGLIATGFISAGPWDFIGHAEVPETKIDGKVARNLDRDNMVTSTMNTFASLTVQCSRCHNHKFDPVTMEDYYSLQAVFASIDRADRKYDTDPSVAKRRRDLDQQREEHETQLASVEKQLKDQKSPQVVELEKRVAGLQKQLTGNAATADAKRSDAYGYHSQVAAKQETEKWVQVDLGESRPIDHVLLFGANEFGQADFGFPERFRVEISDLADFSKTEMLLDETAGDYPRPGPVPLQIAANGKEGRYIRVTATKLWNRRQPGSELTGDWIFSLGELAVLSRGNLAPVAEVTALDSIEAGVRWSRKNLVDGIYGKHPLDVISQPKKNSSPTNGYHSQFASKAETTKWVQVDLGDAQPIEMIRLIPAFPTDWRPDTPGFGFPLRFKLETADEPEFLAPRVLIDQTQEDYPNPQGKTVEFNGLSASGRYVRLTATRLWNRNANTFALAMAEIQVMAASTNVAVGSAVAALDSIDSGRWRTNHLVDGYSSRAALATDDAERLLALVSPTKAKLELDELTARLKKELAASVDQQLIARRELLQADIEKIKKSLSELPPQQVVYAGTVHKGRGAFRGRAGLGPREIHILGRGDVTNLGKIVKPGTVPLIPEVAPRFDLPDDSDEGARRAALAKWLTRDDNPLTWRSIVNRIWLYHFGQGIVDSPNDFGRGGQLPTHPQLLDWLAVEFRDGGQTLKPLHRMICNSATYRQSAAGNAKYQEIDGGNQYLWRMNRRRLTAEEIRDSVLVVAGHLDRSMGGPGFQDFVIEQPAHSPHYEYHKYNPLDPKTHRRAVYRFIVRSQPQPFMSTLDCADPSMSVPKRDETLTALQALTLLNNQFIVAMSDEFASRLESQEETLEAQIVRGYRLALGRKPTTEEQQAITVYARQYGLKNACRAILNLNEFVFID